MEHLDRWLDDCAGQSGKMKESTLENLILRARNGKEFKITKPTSDNGYYKIRIPKTGKYIQKKTRLEVLKALYLFYYGSEYEEKPPCTFATMWDEWYQFEESLTTCKNVKKRKAPATLKHYQNDYAEFFKDTELEKMRMDKISAGQLEDILMKLFDGKNERRVKNVIGYLNCAFSHAYKRERIKRNVFESVERVNLIAVTVAPKPKEDQERILTVQQLQTFAEYIYKRERETPEYMPSYAMELAVLTGMRIGEIVALKWSCIHADYISIDFAERRDDFTGERTIVEPKNQKHRKIPMFEDMHRLFEKIEALNYHNKEGFIFCDSTGKRYTEPVVGNAVRRFGKASLGIDNVSIHRIRRTKASAMNANGVPMMTSCAILGHTPRTETGYYLYNLIENGQMGKILADTAPSNIGKQIAKQSETNVLEFSRTA